MEYKNPTVVTILHLSSEIWILAYSDHYIKCSASLQARGISSIEPKILISVINSLQIKIEILIRKGIKGPFNISVLLIYTTTSIQKELWGY